MTLPAFNSIRTLRLIVVALAAPTLLDCAVDSPSAPHVSAVRAASSSTAKAPAGPTVSSANPPYGDQGTTIDVQILGSGFTSGAAVGWLLHGVTDNHVHTNSAKFVSSGEIDANVTIASDATLSLWDVEVALIGGKNGVGSDAFEVTSAQVLAQANVNFVYGTNELLEVGGYGQDAFVIDDAMRYIDLGPGQVWGLEPQGSTAIGRNGSLFPTAWTRQASGSWTATTLPPAPNSVGGNAMDAAYAADGSLLVSGFDATSGSHSNRTIGLNRPVVWRRTGSTWNPPTMYTLPPGATAASGRTINPLGQIAGNVDASDMGAVWDSPTTPTRLDGLPNAINSAGTLIVGQRNSGSTTGPVYWWRDPVTQAWHTTGVALPTVAGAGCGSGAARGLNDAGVIVGESCNSDGNIQATVWTLDLSSGVPVLVGSAQSLPGLGPKGKGASNVLSSAAGVNGTAPYVVFGSAAASGNQTYPVRWVLRD